MASHSDSYHCSNSDSFTGKCNDDCDSDSVHEGCSDECSVGTYSDSSSSYSSHSYGSSSSSDESSSSSSGDKSSLVHHERSRNICYHRVTFGKRVKPSWSTALNMGMCIFIDGKEAPILQMRRGVTYVFEVVQKGTDHTFVLTKNSMGANPHTGPVLPINGAPEAVSSGEYRYSCNESSPNGFFYQSSKDPLYGHQVRVD